jgi:hypothetical protein
MAKCAGKLVREFLEEYRWEPPGVQPSLLEEEPAATGDERWDVLLAALAEHLAAQRDLAPPGAGAAAAVVPSGVEGATGRGAGVRAGDVPQGP